jgi:F0F1-type ATP synthase membrane subunit b/b'
MTRRSKKPALGAGLIVDILAIPGNFVSGFLTGLVAPIAAIAGMVALMRLLTGKVPYLSNVLEGDAGERGLAFELVEPEQVKELFEEQKEQYGGEITKMQTGIRAIIEEARAQAKTDDGASIP